MKRGCTAALGAVTEGGALECPIHWAKTLKTWVSVDFQKCARSFFGGTGWGRERGWIPCSPQLTGAVACLMDFTELNAIDELVRLDTSDPGFLKKRRFIEIDS